MALPLAPRPRPQNTVPSARTSAALQSGGRAGGRIAETVLYPCMATSSDAGRSYGQDASSRDFDKYSDERTASTLTAVEDFDFQVVRSERAELPRRQKRIRLNTWVEGASDAASGLWRPT